MNLLDGLMGSGWDDPRTMATMQLAAGLLGGAGSSRNPVNLGQLLSTGLSGYQNTMAASKKEKALEKELQMREQEAEMRRQQFAEQMAEAQRRRDQEALLASAWKQANTPAGEPIGDTGDFTAAPQFDMRRFAQGVGQVDPMKGASLMQGLESKRILPLVTKPGDILRDPNDPTRVLAQNAFAPGKPEATPEFARLMLMRGIMPGSPEWNANLDRYIAQKVDPKPIATATANVGMPRIELKTGEGMATQIGPMLRESKLKTEGAMKMFDSASAITKALDAGEVFAGPWASSRMFVAQIGDLVGAGGGSTQEKLLRTRRVIRGLAESAVEARKELAGQGQVTENEAKAVEKAMSGNIDELTDNEIRLIAGLNMKASALRAQEHKRMIDEAAQGEMTKGLVPYYSIGGLDRVSGYKPPTSDIDALIRKYSGQ